MTQPDDLADAIDVPVYTNGWQAISLPAAAGQLLGQGCLLGGLTFFAAGSSGHLQLFDGSGTGGELILDLTAGTNIFSIANLPWPGIYVQSGLYYNPASGIQATGAVYLIPRP